MQFTPQSQCIVYGTHLDMIQRMLDYDFLCGRTPSVAAVMTSGSQRKHKVFYGDKELLLPTINTWDAISNYPEVDTLINLASFRSAPAVTLEAIASDKFKNIVVIAEGIPENDARAMLAAAQPKGITLLGPSTVGGMIAGALRIGNTGGSLDNIMQSRMFQA